MNIETLQIVIIAALSISTVLITIIGIQVVLLLKEVRVITKRINNLSNGFANIAKTVERSLHEVSSVTDTARVIGGIVGKLFNRAKHENDES